MATFTHDWEPSLHGWYERAHLVAMRRCVARGLYSDWPNEVDKLYLACTRPT